MRKPFLDTSNIIRLRPLLPKVGQSYGRHADKLDGLLFSLWEYLLSWHGLEIAEMLPEAISRIDSSEENLTIKFSSDWFLNELQGEIVQEWLDFDVAQTVELVSPGWRFIAHRDTDPIDPQEPGDGCERGRLPCAN
jgi:hypothetical protein